MEKMLNLPFTKLFNYVVVAYSCFKPLTYLFDIVEYRVQVQREN